MAAKAHAQVGNRGTGRRKEAIARVRLVPGTGKILINGKTMELHLTNRPAIHVPVVQPLVVAGVQDRYNVLVRTQGGGIVGQAFAIRLGIARALADINEDYGRLMRKEGFLTVDARVKERKKYGRKRARKRYQYSKR